MSEAEDIVVLYDDDGNEISYEFLDLIEYKGERYVVLFPCGGDEAEGVTICKLEPSDNDDEELYVGVDNEKDLNAVFKIFKEHYADLQ